MNDTNNRKPTMDLEEFDRLVSSYGANAERWPQDLRDEMRAVLARSVEARAIVEREVGLDGLIEAAAAPAPSELLRARILKSAKENRASRTERLDHWAAGLWPPGRTWGPLAALAAAAVLGIVVGTLAPSADTEADNTSHYDTDTIEATLDQLSAMGDTP